MIRRRSTCRTATSMPVAPTNLVADATRRMKFCSRNFNEHEGEIDACCRRSDGRRKGPPRRSARRTGCAGFALAPAAARRRSRWVFRKKMEIRMPKLGPDKHKDLLLDRDTLTHIDKVECAIVEIMFRAW
jgi:hypothetical protein